MIDFLKLVRYKNLIFLAFIQYVMQNMVLLPIMQVYGFSMPMNTIYFNLLVAGTLFIAGGGYVLNDYFDIKIDAINRPDKQLVGVKISRQSAMLAHQLLTGLGVICGFILAFLLHSFTLGFIFIVIPGLLWFYSASYKRQLIIGNLVVAFIASMSILIVGITQLAALQTEYGKLIFETPIPHQIYGWIGGFVFFSFLCTWMREIVKDIEDEKGDREMECHTMPIFWGLKKTKWFLYTLIILTVSALFAANFFLIPFEGTLSLRYIVFGIVIPFAVLCYLIYHAKQIEAYRQASMLLKIIMFVGVLYAFVFYYLEAKAFGLVLFNLFIIK